MGRDNIDDVKIKAVSHFCQKELRCPHSAVADNDNSEINFLFLSPLQSGADVNHNVIGLDRLDLSSHKPFQHLNVVLNRMQGFLILFYDLSEKIVSLSDIKLFRKNGFQMVYKIFIKHKIPVKVHLKLIGYLLNEFPCDQLEADDSLVPAVLFYVA